MAVKIDEGKRLEEPCRACSGPRVALTSEQMPGFAAEARLMAVICLRCDSLMPDRLPVVPKDGA